MTRPLVSVCIPAYGRVRLLGLAIESVLRQTYGDFELVISDDGASADLARSIERFADPRIRLLQQRDRLGIPRNFNAAIDASNGEIIKPLCDDDELHPRCLELIVEPVLEHRFVVVDGPDWDGDGPMQWSDVGVLQATVLERGISAETLRGTACAPSLTAFTRSLWEQCGPYDEATRFAFDWDLLVRVRAIQSILRVHAPLAGFRRWRGSITTSSTDSLRNYEDLLFTLGRLRAEHQVSHAVLARKAVFEGLRYFPGVARGLATGNIRGCFRWARLFYRSLASLRAIPRGT